MARLLKADGTEVEVKPAAGTTFSLAELQGHVGGFIEVMPGMAREFRMILNENGANEDQPKNPAATRVLHEQMAKQLGIPVEELPGEVGHRLRYLPELVGDVLLLSDDEAL